MVFSPHIVGNLPTQLAGLNQTHINVNELIIEAAVTKDREKIYYAAMLDTHTSSELTLPEIKAMVDELIEAMVITCPTLLAK